MTKADSVRARPSKIVRHGRSRSHLFASEDLIGSMRTGLKKGDNAAIRRLARQRLHKKS
jgi:hypothetical protein